MEFEFVEFGFGTTFKFIEFLLFLLLVKRLLAEFILGRNEFKFVEFGFGIFLQFLQFGLLLVQQFLVKFVFGNPSSLLKFIGAAGKRSLFVHEHEWRSRTLF